MHGRNVWLNALSDRPASTDESDATRMAGVRNLFKPKRDQRFAAGTRVAQARAGDERPLRSLLRKLAIRMERGDAWTDILCPDLPGLEASENPCIPSGYTYLLQLMAHDLVDSEVSLAEAGPGKSGFANTRVAPLTLDTIYGGGPDNTPFVYEIDRMVRRYIDSVPRTRLRLGRLSNADGTTAGSPFRDLARAVPLDVSDGGLDPGEALDTAALDAQRCPYDGQRPLRPWRTEALVADMRNDSHALISQLTVLFHILHNHVLGILGPQTMDPVLAYRRYLCARTTVTLIYRSIIVRDVLKRILDPQVYARYTSRGATLLEPGSDDSLLDIPLEFSHGAFRFGHAMTRGEYRVNSPEPQPFGRALELSSVHLPNTLPMRELWHVDWSLFFETGPQPPNFSIRIGPTTAVPLRNRSMFPPASSDLDHWGVSNRDLIGAAYADIWRVPDLMEHVRGMPGMASILPDFAIWRPRLVEWLSQVAGDFSTEEIATLSTDPPLPFFIMFEASHALDAGVPSKKGGGRHLGALGSIIVAETIFGALKRSPVAYEREGATLRDTIAAACAGLLGAEALLDAIPDIPDMPALLKFLKAGNAISLPGPA